MQVKLTGPKVLRLQSPQVAYILDRLSECPFKDVQALIGDIFAQLKHQEEMENESTSGSDGTGAGDGLSGPGSAD